MPSSLTTTYLLPAILLNPVLFLHSLNTILSRILPPLLVVTTTTQQQPAPYSPLGPSASHPHLDVHASDRLCWSYTALMVCAQLVAFGRVSSRRAAGHEKRRRLADAATAATEESKSKHGTLVNGHLDDSLPRSTSSESLGLASTDETTEDEVIL